MMEEKKIESVKVPVYWEGTNEIAEIPVETLKKGSIIIIAPCSSKDT